MHDEDRKSLFLNWLDGHRAAVWQIARAYSLDRDECQDLAQEILLQAWQSLGKFQRKSTPATWFYRVALQTAMNWQRDDKTRRVRQKPLIEVQAIENSAADSVLQIQQRETVEALYDAIHQLPQADKALLLMYLDELSYQEMAEILGISENYVGVKLNRARKALNELMKGQPREQ